MAKRGNGEGSFRQRPDGTWEVRLSLPDGKRKSFYGKTRTEAAAKMKQAQKDIDNGINLEASRQSVSEYLDRWLSASVKPSVKTKTYEGYESIVRVRVVPRIGRIPLARLTALDLQGLYADLESAGLSRRCVHHTHRALHRALGQAVRWGLISRNPCDGVTAPKPERHQMQVLDRDQVAALVLATADHPSHALYVLAVTTGMRIGELLGLRWQDVELDAGHVVV